MSVRAGTGSLRGRGTKRVVFAVQNFMGKKTHEVLYCKDCGRSYSDGGEGWRGSGWAWRSVTHVDSKGLERGAICKETDGGDGMGNGEREGERERGGECAIDGEMEHCG